MSFSDCVQGRVETSASRVPRFSRVRVAKIWLSRWKSIHSKERVSKQSSKGFQASQHRMRVPRCRFRKARKAIEVIRSFAPMQSGVCFNGSRVVISLAFMQKDFKFSQRTKRVRRETVVIMKLLQDRTKKRIFGHPTGNTVVLVSSTRRFLDEETNCSMITRKSFLPKVLNDMRRAVEITCVSHREVIKIRSILDRVRFMSNGRGSSPGVIRLGNFKDMWKERMEHSSLSWPSVNVWFQTLNRPSSGSQMLKSPQNNSHTTEICKPMWVNNT